MRPHSCFFLLIVLLLIACDRSPSRIYPQRTPPTGADAPSVADGAALFRRLCASCHGTTAEGRSPRADFFVPPAPDFREASDRRSDPAYLYWRIEHGKTVEPYLSQGSVMPSWGETLSPGEIWSLVVYLQSRN